ncbi:LysR family transcriptional regulator [Paludibacterium sp. B53371]|uniref:LysR family transcriptional regulator n=1 Tax=Paludibacterium sp. B53371 TaxID=2806263 RepID=UPI001C03C774|nr:LysR family transcriptional regulator [Paludibacterium sp. B53371]
MFPLNLMAIFARVAEAGSFTLAAEQLQLPKSTVSQRVAELEAILQIRLLQRTTRKLSLTEAGKTYLHYCQAMLEQVEAGNAALSLMRDQPAGSLRITSPEASAILLLPPLLADFEQRYPEVRVQLIASDEPLDLIAEGIDLAIRTGKLDDSSYVSRKIGSVRRQLVAAPAYLQAHGQPASPAELSRHRLLRHLSAPIWYLQQDQGSQPLVLPDRASSSNSLLSLCQLAIHGRGIAMLPAFVCRQALQQQQLAEVLPDVPVRPSDYYMIYPSRSHPSAALVALIQHLQGSTLAAQIA